jgi:hypothetical protein
MNLWIAVLQMKSWIVLSFLLGTTWAVGFLIQDGIQATLTLKNYKSKRRPQKIQSVKRTLRENFLSWNVKKVWTTLTEI